MFQDQINYYSKLTNVVMFQNIDDKVSFNSN